MASKDYVPSNEVDFKAWAATLVAWLITNGETVGLLEADATAVNTQNTLFASAYTDNSTKQAASKAARQAKDTAKKNLTASLRSLVTRIQAHPNFSDANRATLGLTIKDTIPTPISAPSTIPVLSIDFSERGRHKIYFRDSATPTSTAKPKGVRGCAVYMKVGATQPNGIATMEYLGTYTSQGKAVAFEESQYGQQAYYVGFWETAKGEHGGQSDFTNATISK